MGGRLRFADIWLVIGTRPEAIKLSPVAAALRSGGVDPLLLVTGQHPQLDLASFGLSDFRSVELDCPGQTNPYNHARQVEERVRDQFQRHPDLLVVQGDTSSAFGAAQAAFAAGVPVAHVEAGLRTYDPRLPWPEQEFRSAIDARALLLFAPTALAAANLASERLDGAVHITGNSGIDALIETVARLPPEPLRAAGHQRILVTCLRRETWGSGLAEIGDAIAAIAEGENVRIEVVLHPNPAVARPLSERLRRLKHIALLAPMSHSDLIERMRGCDLLLSDSGGIQEEAPALGVPLLVLRDKTERPEAITSGNARLVGVKAERIIAEARALLGNPVERAAMARRNFPFGDGRSAPRMARIIEQWLTTRTRGSRAFRTR
ncbi:MAG: UDP-N-acetylglucosamine 2-epimerase (non-hydrolyzing) [Sphingomonas sp.]|nr:UDP-N-acetylglucosamine 2-epimerase (non-hydrolyzing) [Sphingomonas sp.]